MSEFERITRVALPFDMRHTDDNKNYGIHGIQMWFVLKGPKGAVQFVLSADCQLPHVQQELGRPGGEFSGFDVGYHSPKPMYESHKQMECDLLPGGKCYYDGSSLRAVEWTDIILSTRGRRPEDVLWPMLEREYRERFDE